MLHADEETTFVGLAELRKESPRFLKEIQTHKVVLTKRNKPVGVVVNYDEYKRMEALIDLLEDLVLADEVSKRLKKKHPKYISLEEAERRVEIR